MFVMLVPAAGSNSPVSFADKDRPSWSLPASAAAARLSFVSVARRNNEKSGARTAANA
jgi:hypothetical protein